VAKALSGAELDVGFFIGIVGDCNADLCDLDRVVLNGSRVKMDGKNRTA